MHVFMTGASGWIGSAVIPELLAAGHTVLGLARSERAAAAIETLGAEAHLGNLDDLDSLKAGASACEGVIHLGYNHDFSDMAGAAHTDAAALAALREVLSGSDRPLVLAAGVLGLVEEGIATEQDVPAMIGHPRIPNVARALEFAAEGIRVSSVRFAPTVHGAGDPGFVATLVAIARDKGVSAYIGEGNGRWPAVHVLDAASLVRLTLEKATAGTSVHAVAEQGVPTRAIAEAIGAGLGLPVESVPADQAAQQFGWIGMFFAMNTQASNAITRSTLGWAPTHPTLLEDLASGSYFRGPSDPAAG